MLPVSIFLAARAVLPHFKCCDWLGLRSAGLQNTPRIRALPGCLRLRSPHGLSQRVALLSLFPGTEVLVGKKAPYLSDEISITCNTFAGVPEKSSVTGGCFMFINKLLLRESLC